MHHSRLACLVIDCKTDNLGRETGFWSDALGLPVKEVPEGDPAYAVLQEAPGQPKILLQAVAHESRVHLDIETDDIEAEVKRLEALGAKRIGLVKRWCVMEAPSGQRFCVVNPQRDDFPAGANEWP
ncbi:VOC family protein [Pelagibius sp. 7325]|uniref:VOC family protein n=1 Tax=Pelagibius sp. 7325 TaxID=3131994 RepID=UPI0030EF891A